MSIEADKTPEQVPVEPGASNDRLQEKRIGFAFLSALIPGAGQIAAGYRWRGAVMIGATIIVLVVAFYYYQQGLSTILSYLVQPRYLIALFIINILVLLFRLGAVVDVFLATRPLEPQETTGWKQAIIGTVLVLLLSVTAAPHAVLGYYTYLSHELITDVFSSVDLSVDPIPTTAPVSDPTPTPVPEPTATPEPTPEPGFIGTTGFVPLTFAVGESSMDDHLPPTQTIQEAVQQSDRASRLLSRN